MARLRVGEQTGSLIVLIPYEYEGHTVNDYMSAENDDGSMTPPAVTNPLDYVVDSSVRIINGQDKVPFNVIRDISFPNLEIVNGSQCLYYAFKDNNLIRSFSAPKLREIRGSSSCGYMCDNNGTNMSLSDFTHAPDLHSLEIIDGYAACANMFAYCDSLTGHLDLGKLRVIRGYYAANNLFTSAKFTSIDIHSLEEVDGSNAFANAFAYCLADRVVFASLKKINGERCLYEVFAYSTVERIDFPALEEAHPTSGNRFFYYLRAYQADHPLELNYDSLHTIYDCGWSSYGMFGQMCGSTTKQMKAYFPSLKNVTASYSMSNSKHPFYKMFTQNNTTTPHEIHFLKKMSGATWAGRTIDYCVKVFDLIDEIVVGGVTYFRNEINSIRNTDYIKTAVCWKDENESKIYTVFNDTTKAEPDVGTEAYTDGSCTISAGTISAVA